MLETLYRAEKELPRLLEDISAWNSLLIDYEQPVVERLWLPWEGEYRLSLHYIHPCPSGRALLHAHAWPSAMRIHENRYEMKIGYAVGDHPPLVTDRLILETGSVYEMTNPDLWHAVNPLDGPVMTFMVTGKPWGRSAPKSPRALKGLSPERCAAILSFFRGRYCSVPRMKPPYYTIEQLLGKIDEPNRSACLRMFFENRKLFQTVQGSTNNHQAWKGGYADHIQEVMNIAALQYWLMSALRPLPFSLSDLLLVVFLHDLEKPWKYELRADGQLHHRVGMETKEDHQRFRMAKLAEYGIVLTGEHQNGIKYAEGELSDYSPRERKMNPLAAMAHMCDVWSARGWFEHPFAEHDPWGGAGRNRD